MNQSPRLDPALRAELTRLLPPPGDPELPAYRHRLLKDAFLQQIAEQPAVFARRRRGLFAVPVAAAVVVATLVGVTAHNRHRAGEVAVSHSPIVAVAAGNAAGAAPLLQRMAQVVGDTPRVTIGKGEYVYIKSAAAWLVFPGDVRSGPKEAGGDAQVLDEVHTREVWVPATQGGEGMIREHGETFGSTGAPSNSYYADLPTDPDALLRKVYADTRGQGDSADYAAFDFLGQALFESLLPPQVAAAIYRAAAKIPGVALITDSVDAAGRHGIAVACTDESSGQRREWIFNPSTFEYLGERSYLVHDTAAGKTGTLTGTSAVLERGVVRRKGDLPK